jgi:hypothetical protein
VPLVVPVALDHKDQLVLQVKTEAQDSPVNQVDLVVPVIKDLKDPKDQLETQAVKKNFFLQNFYFFNYCQRL